MPPAPKEVRLFSRASKDRPVDDTERRLFICPEDPGRTAEVAEARCAAPWAQRAHGCV